MRCFLLRGWTGVCLLIPLLTCGCQHNQLCCLPCNVQTAATMGTPVAVPSGPNPAVGAPASQPVQPPVKTLPPVVHLTAKPPLPTPSDPLRRPAPQKQPSVSAPYAEVKPVSQPTLPATDPDGPAADAPRLAHDPNYHWLVGTLDYSRIQQAWVLRYVSYEEEDRYGGCVTLVASSRSLKFKPGQLVRVEGALIDPESQQLRPAFEVRSIRAQ
jgi:hypothetical protein